MKHVLMDGYVIDRNEKKTINGEEVDITTFQGKHCDEYLLREMKSGRCSLFYKGIVQLSWEENNGIRKEGFIVYEHGRVQRREKWASLWNEREHRSLGNSKTGLELVVEEDGVVYRGELDNVESMKREGRGMEFDKESGRVLRCGVWKNDKLFQIIQEFESEDVMIEYAIEEGESNLSVLNRHPVYEGGYVFDEKILRHGHGCEIDVNTGIAVREGVWERGELKESVKLFDGWYVKMKGSEVFDWGRGVEDLRVEIHSLTEGESVSSNVTELVIPSNCCNEEEWSVFDVSELKWLKSIEIGDDCFENVEEVKLIGLNRLERVVIGKKSFTKEKNGWGYDPNRHFYLKNCERVREMKIGGYSFSGYSVCEIENLPSLEVIEIGELDEDSYNFFCNHNLELKSDSQRVK